MQESGEMYLETILVLGKQSNIVRAVDVADEMKLTKASVSRALSKLKSAECIIVDSGGQIAFTEKGRQIAEKIYQRHQVLTDVLMRLGVDKDTASGDACKIEHYISDVTFNALQKYLQDNKADK